MWRARVCACVCVCACVREEGSDVCLRACMRVCVCVCVCCVYVCVCAYVCVSLRVAPLVSLLDLELLYSELLPLFRASSNIAHLRNPLPSGAG